MKTVELFCGTKSFSKVAKDRGHDTFTVDIDPRFSPDLVGDLLSEPVQDAVMAKVRDADIVWMSPVCGYWSMSAGNTYWTKYRMPRNDGALTGFKMMMFCRFVADYCIKNKKLFFIENPNGRAVWILDNQYLKRCWYCQYGDTRAKPTNIWTNLDITFRCCRNNNKSCHHEAAPRGSKTGTQGGADSVERSIIPEKLFIEIFDKIDSNHPSISNRLARPCA